MADCAVVGGGTGPARSCSSSLPPSSESLDPFRRRRRRLGASAAAGSLLRPNTSLHAPTKGEPVLLPLFDLKLLLALLASNWAIGSRAPRASMAAARAISGLPLLATRRTEPALAERRIIASSARLRWRSSDRRTRDGSSAGSGLQSPGIGGIHDRKDAASGIMRVSWERCCSGADYE